LEKDEQKRRNEGKKIHGSGKSERESELRINSLEGDL